MWVDGIQRVVCGATLDTTCQDVVIALAHAMGRTGRFTLIEKWRDSDRPLSPSECPLRVLYKWGEYAAEVRFVLCQADSDKQQQPQNKDKLRKKAGDKLSHNFSPPRVAGIQGGGGDSTVKRSLTFSGAHNYPSDSPMSLSSSTPMSKFRKTHLGPVPNGDVRAAASFPRTSQQLPSSGTHSVISSSRGIGQQGRPSAPPQQTQHREQPVPHPRHKRSSPAPRQDHLHNSGSGAAPSSSAANDHHQTFINHTRVPPTQPNLAQSHPHPAPHSHSQPQPGTPHLLQPQPGYPGHVQNQGNAQPLNQNVPSSRDSTPPPLPSSLPPDAHPSFHPAAQEHQKALVAVEATLDSAEHSRQASLEIEEYDLDRNFPDVAREVNRGERPAVSLEYRLGEGVATGSGVGGHLEGEHARLVRLVNMQQERLKTQESQISMVNTEISALEEQEKEYEEKLQMIMEELLLQENRHHDLELEVTDLEGVEWENVLDGEKKCEHDLTRQVEVCKANIAEHKQKLNEIQKRERDLHAEINQEEERLSSERSRLQAEEKRAAEEASKLKENIQKLKAESSEVEKSILEGETSLSAIDKDIQALDTDLAKKTAELEEMEKELKKENLKNFTAHPAPKENPGPKDSGETILKILEGRLSPRPPSVSSRGPDSPTSPPFIAALASKTQSGVWV